MTDTTDRRRERRVRQAAATVAQPMRQITYDLPVYDLLSAAGLDRLHAAAMRILSEFGIDFYDAEVRAILKDHGAQDIYISATHAVFAPPALEKSRLLGCPFTKLAVTDTIAIGTRCDPVKDRLVVLSVAELLGEAIHRIHHNASVSALFKGDPGRAMSE